MATYLEDEACATDRIVEVETGEIVGLIYVWEDGTKQPLWFNGEKPSVVFVSIQREHHLAKVEVKVWPSGSTT